MVSGYCRMQHGTHKLTLTGFMVGRRPRPSGLVRASGTGGVRAGGPGGALDGTFTVQAMVCLVVCHTVLFIEQVGRLIWQPVVQLRKSQFNFSVFTV